VFQTVEDRTLHRESSGSLIRPAAANVDDDHAVAVETALDGVQIHQRAQEQRRSDDQDRGDCQLRDDEAFPQPSVPLHPRLL